MLPDMLNPAHTQATHTERYWKKDTASRKSHRPISFCSEKFSTSPQRIRHSPQCIAPIQAVSFPQHENSFFAMTFGFESAQRQSARALDRSHRRIPNQQGQISTELE